MNNFTGEITLANGWQNLITLLIAADYEGYSVLSNLHLKETSGNNVRVKAGHNSSSTEPAAVDEGVPLASDSLSLQNVDANMCWIYADGAHPVLIAATSSV